MAFVFDYNKDYVMKTPYGNFKLVVIHFQGNMGSYNGYLSGHGYYKGISTTNPNIEYSGSVRGLSKYPVNNTPLMGSVPVLKSDGTESVFRFNDVAYSNWGRFEFRESNRVFFSDSPAVEAASGFINLVLLCLIVDDYDHYTFAPFNMRNRQTEISWTPNTAISYGYATGKVYQIYDTYVSSGNVRTGASTVLDGVVVEVKTDPYTPGGNTEPGGGDGTGPEGIINDDIDFPTPLAISASNANFISIWTPTLDQVQTLAKWMWTTDPLKWEFWQKLLQNPLDLIFSLTIMPVPIFHPHEGGSPTEDELIANTDSLSLGWQDTGILMDWVSKQYVTIDMGKINLEEVWGAFLDYEPYTKIDIFLPYIGTKQLDTNDCMPRSISLRYVIDLATGTCVALIKCDNSVYYHFSGNCASQIPITVNQCQEIVRGLMTMAVGAATFALGGPMGAGAHASKAAIAKGAAMKAGGAAMVGSGADSAAKGVNVSRSGVIGAAAGLMDVQTPYLIISRPRQAVPEEQNKYTGYPSFITEQIGDLTGYTEVQMIHLHNMSCTDEEYKEIDSLLTQGVII